MLTVFNNKKKITRYHEISVTMGSQFYRSSLLVGLDMSVHLWDRMFCFHSLN